MAGDDAEDTALLEEMLAEARAYLLRQRWCGSIADTYWGDGVGGVVAVFLFRVAMHGSQNTREEWVWVICGDVPTMYLATDELHEPGQALGRYCDLLEEWVAVARAGGDLRTVLPIAADPTAEHIAMLEQRIDFLRADIIPALTERRAHRRR